MIGPSAIRDCGDQPWTIRVAPLHGTGRVQLSLYLPKEAVNAAIQRVAHLAPAAEVRQLREIPKALTDAWSDLIHAESSRAPIRPAMPSAPDADPAGHPGAVVKLFRARR